MAKTRFRFASVFCAFCWAGLAGAEDLSGYESCGSSEYAKRLAKLIITDPDQNRESLVCNAMLSKIAEDKAAEMAQMGWVTHFGSSSANKRLISAGYSLSKIYPRMLENNVEAIAGGLKDPGSAWAGFRNSEAHRAHMLAEHEFYRLQNEIGVGYHHQRNSPHEHYWVVYIAHREERTGFKGEIAPSKD